MFFCWLWMQSIDVKVKVNLAITPPWLKSRPELQTVNKKV